MILVATASDERALPYGEALAAVGFEDFQTVTPSSLAPGEARSLASRASGLVLCGGADVAPERYGEEVWNDTVEVMEERDALEWALLEGAREARVPVWGVCRGLQVLNVFLGGSLWQDLPSQRPTGVPHSQDNPKDRLVHTVTVLEPERPLGELLARSSPHGAWVNSRHHQAVKRLADGLVSVAEAPDGLVEAFVLDRPDWWVRAVQWHPENLIAHAQHRTLWEDFVRAVRP